MPCHRASRQDPERQAFHVIERTRTTQRLLTTCSSGLTDAPIFFVSYILQDVVVVAGHAPAAAVLQFYRAEVARRRAGVHRPHSRKITRTSAAAPSARPRCSAGRVTPAGPGARARSAAARRDRRWRAARLARSPATPAPARRLPRVALPL